MIAEVIEGETTEIAIRQAQPAIPPAPQLLDALRPAERVALMTEISDVVKDVIERQGWFKQIGPKKHILIQGWTFIGGLGGCAAKTTHTEPIEDGYKAHAVVVRVDSGVEVGAADQVCKTTESKWKGKDDYALVGMASTRACSRALSTVFRHVVELAGYSATPAEEITDVVEGRRRAKQADDRPPITTADLLKLAQQKGIASFGDWIIEHIASDFAERPRKVLMLDEAAKADQLLRALPDAAAEAPARATRKPSEKQKGLLFALHSQLEHNDGDRHIIYQRLAGKSSYALLTSDEVGKIIDYLDKLT